ncbi:MAG: hypothetical protein MJY69_08990, partial [Bacteroidales bacterium]|nr:hypothetical protein [Bacteroidales bacterium]
TASPKISGKLQKIFLINIKAAGYSLRGISLFLAPQSVVKFVGTLLSFIQTNEAERRREFEGYAPQ